MNQTDNLQMGQEKKPAKKMSLGKKLLIGAIVALVVALVAAAAGFAAYSRYRQEMELEQWLNRSISVGGITCKWDVEEIAISDSDFVSYSDLSQFTELKKLDITALDLTTEEFDEIASAVPEGVEIVWSVPLNGEKYSSDIQSFSITENIAPEELQKVKYFTSLTSLDAEYSLCDEFAEFVQTVSDSDFGDELEFTYSSEIYGVTVTSEDERLYLNEISVRRLDSDLSELRLAIETFPNLTAIEMIDCGLSNETMGGLRDEFPDVQFVWTIQVLKYTIRTDAQVFSTLVADMADHVGDEDDFAPLFEYCTELRALDLGHHYLKNISKIANLKKLQVLILADNYINDISALSELEDLEYLELFSNSVRKVAPLTELKNLKYLNIYGDTYITDITEIAKCTSLTRLYIGRCGLSDDEKALIEEALGDTCEVNTTARKPANDGWRDDEMVITIGEIFSKWDKVVEFNSWDDVVYSE